MTTEEYTIPDGTAPAIPIGKCGHPDQIKSPRIAFPGAFDSLHPQGTAYPGWIPI